MYLNALQIKSKFYIIFNIKKKHFETSFPPETYNLRNLMQFYGNIFMFSDFDFLVNFLYCFAD